MIPTLLFWENGNTWYGSLGQARFFIQPVKPEEENAPATLKAEVWKGPLTRQLSEILATASFPLSEEGLSQVVLWLEEQAKPLNE
jgi:hypothetical protein